MIIESAESLTKLDFPVVLKTKSASVEDQQQATPIKSELFLNVIEKQPSM
jgi:hypothetical protein